jgi:hypothetical protein
MRELIMVTRDCSRVLADETDMSRAEERRNWKVSKGYN